MVFILTRILRGVVNRLFSYIQIYPNLVSGNFKITSSLKIKEMDVYSTFGQIVKSFEGAEGYIGELTNGVYLVQVEFENGSKSIEKRIKN